MSPYAKTYSLTLRPEPQRKQRRPNLAPALLAHGWTARTWTARKGYALTDEAVANSASETIWCSPHCVRAQSDQNDLFADAA